MAEGEVGGGCERVKKSHLASDETEGQLLTLLGACVCVHLHIYVCSCTDVCIHVCLYACVGGGTCSMVMFGYPQCRHVYVCMCACICMFVHVRT